MVLSQDRQLAKKRKNLMTFNHDESLDLQIQETFKLSKGFRSRLKLL